MRTAIVLVALMLLAACDGSGGGGTQARGDASDDGGIEPGDGAAPDGGDGDGDGDGGGDGDGDSGAPSRCGDDQPCCPDGSEPLFGSSRDDTLQGSDEAECLLALAGDDTASGGGGSDTLVCGDGADDCRGGSGDDVLIGQDGDDALHGEAGEDTLLGEAGDDRLYGGHDADLLSGGAGDDALDGEAGDDTLDPGPGRDTVLGGDGDDVIVIASLCDVVDGETIDGGPGRDTLRAPIGAEELAERGVQITAVERFERTPAAAGECATACPEGTHREHARQTDGLSRQSSYDDRTTDASARRDRVSDYRCVPDTSCDEVDCGDHGRCIEGEGVALCECDDGYVGQACADCAPGYEAQRGGCALTASCDRDQCSGRGTCVQARDGLQCECEAGVAGPRCTHCAEGFHAEGARCVRDESCRADSCSGHGTCTARGGELRCACDRDYAGPRCELTCIENDCNGRGSCAALNGVPTCRCTEGYDPLTDCASCETGYTSDTTSQPGMLLCVRSASCPSDGCSGHGTCTVDLAVGRVCTCEAGYSGSTCADCASGYVRVGERCVSAETCAASACSGHGSCDLRGRVGSCVCDRGYGGDDCSELNEPTQVLIRGAEQTLLTADPIELSAEVYGVGDFDDTLTWQIVDGPGSIVSDGATATFMPPSDLTAPQTTTIAVFSPGGGTWQTTLQTFPPDEGAIPIRRGNGANDFRFGSLDTAITDFMRARCAGAVVVAVSRYGAEVYRAGYGRRYGAPVEDELWLERCPHDDFEPGNWVTEPTTPFYIGSNNKAITAAMAWEAARRRYEAVHGVEPNANQLYAMKICNAAYDLLPARLRGVLCGEEPLVGQPYNGADPSLPPYLTYAAAADACAEAPCNNAGVCSPVFAGYSGIMPLYVPFCACPQGFSGGTCMLCPEIQASPPRFDARFENVSLGDVVSHRSGLPRGGADDGVLFEALATLRGLTSAGDFADQEAEVDPSGTAKSNLQDVRDVTFDDDREAFFVPQPTDLEAALVNAGTCLERAPGSESYSNYGYQLLQILVTHVFDKRYTALQGEPGAHVGSALQEFLHDELGLLSGEATPFGIYGGQQVPGLVEPVETSYRYYSGASYYPLAYDVKRPDCVWDGSSCSFGEWLSGPRFNFLMSPPNTDPAARVPIDFAGSGTGPGIGGLVVEHPIWLRFMRKFWVAGSTPPTYGQRRLNVWTTDRAHSGKRPTAMFSYQRQLGTGTLNYEIPPLEAGGHIALDADQDELVSMSCPKPNGVDVIVTVNQTRDELCADEEGEDAPGYTCAQAYERLMGYVEHGLCGVQWSLVQTDPFGVVQPLPPDPCASQGGLSPGCIAIGD